MLSNARKSLLTGASAGAATRSRLAIQTRTASVAANAFKNNGPAKKNQQAKPKRDKITGSFLPLPAKEVNPSIVRNENALEGVSHMGKGFNLSNHVGKPVKFPNNELAKAYGLPRNVLVDFRLLSAPCFVTRKVTKELVTQLEDSSKKSSSETRAVLTGPSGCGKSYLMLQAVAHCSVNDWIVLYIPRAHKFVDSSTSYFYDSRTQTYLQPIASNQILQRLFSVNKPILEKLRVTEEVAFEKRKNVMPGEPLKVLFELASTEMHLAPTILTAVLNEIGKQDKYPVLLAVDELQALYGKTQYRDQHFQHIKTYHLSVPRLLLEYASGRRTFKRGAFIGAVAPSLTHFPIPLELKRQLLPEESSSPYTKTLPGMIEYAKGLKSFKVPEKLEYTEASAIFELWMKDGALHSNPTDELFLAKYAESSGNARDFVHRGLLAAQMS